MLIPMQKMRITVTTIAAMTTIRLEAAATKEGKEVRVFVVPVPHQPWDLPN